MSREIDVNDPDSWDDTDKEYLRERIDTVPMQHRSALSVEMPMAPQAVVEDPSITRLRNYVRINFPERAGEDPVTVVIDELGGDEVEAPEDDGDDYDKWTIAELSAEAKKRQMTEGEVPAGNDAKRKQPWVDSLRRWDAAHPES